ncbi:MAG: TonB family protein [Cyclobacteriaceae bacterium]|jgi:TonB family protein|nr:TonB family protein [Cytophagales bacterium]MCZ8327360.1 TonB family protein [Cyclobacteriaceae bacterium]
MDKYQHDIERYVNGSMTNAEKHAFEKKMLSDPFLAEAVEGAQQAENFSLEVNDLIKAIDTEKKNKRGFIWWQLAAAVLLVASSSYFVWNYLQEDKKEIESIAQVESKNEIIQQPDTIQSMGKDLIAENKIETSKKDEPAIKVEEKPEEKVNAQAVDVITHIQAGEIAEAEIKTEPTVEADEKAVVSAAPIAETKPSLKPEDLRDKIQEEIKKESKAKRSAFVANTVKVSGKVTSAEDGSFIPGINVVEKGTTNGTISKEDGSYELTLTTGNPILVFSFIGMRTLEIPVGERNVIDAELSTDVTQLSEVVVTGYGGGAEKENTGYEQARPVAGWAAYQHYLDKHIVYPEEAKQQQKEGRVTISFQVNTDGSLSDFEIMRSAGFGMDEALLEVIKKGPAWQPAKNNGLAIKGKATVRYRFRLK